MLCPSRLLLLLERHQHRTHVTPPAACVSPGRGAVYTYDAIGSYERTGYSCQGSGKDLMQPVLDNQLKAASPLLVPARVRGGAGHAAHCGQGALLLWHCAGQQGTVVSTVDLAATGDMLVPWVLRADASVCGCVLLCCPVAAELCD